MAIKIPTTVACIRDTYRARTTISSLFFSLAKTNNSNPRINTESRVRGIGEFKSDTSKTTADATATISPTALNRLGKMNRK